MRSGMPPGLDAIVLKCVDPDPNKRYASAAEVREALVPLRTMVVNGTMPKAPRDRSHSFALPAKRIAGVLLALAALVLAGAGAYYANTVVPEQAEAAVPNGMGTASLEGQSLYDSYASLKSRVRTTADERGGAGMADVLATGDDLWARAETTYESGQLDQAALLAQEAFTHFMAAIIQPGGMVFVPPGDTWLDGERVTVGGFLMDETEVSVLDFRNFTQNVEGGWPFPAVMAESPDNFAMAAVTYYDAQAFAANHGKQLPSVAQWARAAYAAEARAYPWGSEWLAENCDCLNGQESEGTPEQIGQFEADRSVFGVRDMAGGVSEWTSTAQAGQQAAEQLPTFGTQMLIRGGNFNAAEVPLTQSFNWLYEERAPIIGFRCVKSIPSTPVAVKQVLDQS
jgi:formylglycine-generating enzyme required for sulfatase activity